MTIETIYRAVDGESFDNREACERHEACLIEDYVYVKRKTKFYDKDFNILPFPTVEEFYRGLEYKYREDIDMISTEAECFSDIDCFFDRAGDCTRMIDQLSEIDLYVYDERRYGYVPIDEKAIKALTFVKKLESLGLIPGLEQIMAKRKASKCTEEDTNE